jgi:hypothetical protein
VAPAARPPHDVGGAHQFRMQQLCSRFELASLAEGKKLRGTSGCALLKCKARCFSMSHKSDTRRTLRQAATVKENKRAALTAVIRGAFVREGHKRSV